MVCQRLAKIIAYKKKSHINKRNNFAVDIGFSLCQTASPKDKTNSERKGRAMQRNKFVSKRYYENKIKITFVF